MELGTAVRRSFARCFAVTGTAVVVAATLPARAHISFEEAGTHLSRYGDSEIKDGPCGRAGGKRGTNVYTYEPGQTITISVVEFVPHPGYFRIAFDDDGDDAFVEPRSIKPVDSKRACPYNEFDKCGESDFYNSKAVLMDNLDPHLAGGDKTYTWQVKLPDIECDNCTLQVIQVMEDVVHGPYSPKGASKERFYIEDIYHQCIDLVLKRGASPADNPTPPVAGGSDAGQVTPGTPSGTDSGASGGASQDGSTDTTTSPSTGSGTGAGFPDSQGASDGCSVRAAKPAAAGLGSTAAWLVPAALYLARRRRSRG